MQSGCSSGYGAFIISGISPSACSPDTPTPKVPENDNEPVALLYTTCDDFDPDACLSCLNQTYKNTRLIICDDSSHESSKEEIDRWVKTNAPNAVIVRRPARKGFKAGNLNNVIRNVVTEEFLVVCDADEVVPPDFVATMLVECRWPDVAFVQARHIARRDNQTNFGSNARPDNRHLQQTQPPAPKPIRLCRLLRSRHHDPTQRMGSGQRFPRLSPKISALRLDASRKV